MLCVGLLTNGVFIVSGATTPLDFQLIEGSLK